MLKDTVFAATEVGRLTGRKSLSGAVVTPDLVRAVISRNPEFQRLDGILVGLAETCLNPAGRDAVQVIGICSAVKGEGKTTVALGLATALARRGDSEVLLIEGDLASPTMAEDLNQNQTAGLVECLRLEEALEDAIKPAPIQHLSLITAGQASEDPISTVGNSNLRELLRALRSRFRYILLDMPAILEREEAGRLVELVDGVILVVAAGKVSKEVTESGVAAIGRDKLMGVVLNRARTAAPVWLSRIISSDGATPVS